MRKGVDFLYPPFGFEFSILTISTHRNAESTYDSTENATITR